MAFDIAVFRQSFPAFADETTYPDAMIEIWAGLGDKLLNVERWGDFYDEGLRFFVAHEVYLAAKAATATDTDSASEGGLVASLGAGPLSVSFDNQPALEKDAGHYNLTTYGKQYWRLVQIVGMGGAFV